ncbi:MAG TPA: sulfotransferase [Gaiellales bacterium]|nr:sulfotransferase [Gaiellales bacterium]
MPDFFIVGHHKSGTTALYEMLARHPQIFMSAIKEPRYLAQDMRPRFPSQRGHALPQTLDEYLSLFAGATAGQRAGEATPSYLLSHTAAARIAELQPRARVIALLREPATFLHSLHLQLLRSHVETEKDLLKAIALEALRREGKRIPARSHLPQLLQYSEHVHYAEQLKRYHAVLPAEQVLVLIFEEFQSDNQATLQRVLRFLDVDDEHELDELHPKRTTHAMRSQQLDDIMYSVTQGSSPTARAARATVKALAPRRLRRGAFRTVRRKGVLEDVTPPDDRLVRELRHRFRSDVEAVSAYLGRDLVSLWGYGQLA